MIGEVIYMKAKRHINPPLRKNKLNPVFTLTALAAAMLSVTAGANEYSYANDPGFVASNLGEMAAAKASWETAEYLRSGGLAVLNASSAYALGYFGQNRTVGVMDSGSLATHRDFQGARWTFVIQEGVYSYDGMRYRGAGYTPTNGGSPYKAGDPFYITGAYDSTVNDSHGTSVTGIVGGNRDGAVVYGTDSNASTDLNMHGIAFGADMVIGNTGATDSNNYGPYLDYNFFYTSWKAMVDAGAEVINNSWGTNIRINLERSGNYPFDDTGVDPDTGVLNSGVANNYEKGIDGCDVGNMSHINNVPETMPAPSTARCTPTSTPRRKSTGSRRRGS